jgi:hypothetical protein
VATLRQELQNRNLLITGVKSALLKRLNEHDAKENAQDLELLLKSINQSHVEQT